MKDHQGRRGNLPSSFYRKQAMQNGNRILRPNSTAVQFTHHPGAMATQLTVTANNPAGIEVHSFGGFTKVEALAGMQMGYWLEAFTDDNGVDMEAAAGCAMDGALALVAEFNRRALEAAKAQQPAPEAQA